MYICKCIYVCIYVDVSTAHLGFVVGQDPTEVTQRNTVRVLDKYRIHM